MKKCIKCSGKLVKGGMSKSYHVDSEPKYSQRFYCKQCNKYSTKFNEDGN